MHSSPVGNMTSQPVRGLRMWGRDASGLGWQDREYLATPKVQPVRRIRKCAPFGAMSLLRVPGILAPQGAERSWVAGPPHRMRVRLSRRPPCPRGKIRNSPGLSHCPEAAMHPPGLLRCSAFIEVQESSLKPVGIRKGRNRRQSSNWQGRGESPLGPVSQAGSQLPIGRVGRHRQFPCGDSM